MKTLTILGIITLLGLIIIVLGMMKSKEVDEKYTLDNFS